MNKKKVKIVLSLLITMAFILPSGGIFAQTSVGETEAVELQEIGQPNHSTSEGDLGDPRVIWGDDIIPQDYPVDCWVLVQGLEGIEHEGLLETGTHDLILRMKADECCQYPLPYVKAFAEVYKKGCGEEIILYETSFEDNFDIYSNWVQIDKDCGYDGYYDSFSWSDARASDGDHSMKSTMYDIYKGNQEDYLMCTKTFNVTEQDKVKVTFDIWVDGDGAFLGHYMPPEEFNDRVWTLFDYLSFEVSDETKAASDIWINPDNYGNGLAMNDVEFDLNDDGYIDPPDELLDDIMLFAGSSEEEGDFLPGAYKFYDTIYRGVFDSFYYNDYLPKARMIGDGWWNVEWTIPVSELVTHPLNFDTDNMMFRFDWHTDPQFQFEGAYVDNFKVISIEGTEEKVFQTHSQGAFKLDDTEKVSYDGTYYYYKFPLQWDAIYTGECGKKETEYIIKLWIEVLDEHWGTPYDMPPFGEGPTEVQVLVGDWFDIEIGDIMIETSFDEDPIIDYGETEGTMIAGDDAHIIVEDVCVGGSLPAEDIPVVAYAQKKQWEEVYFWDVESIAPGFQTGAFESPYLGNVINDWHRTTVDSWNGDYALGFFDENTNHYKNDVYYAYALLAPVLDMENVEEMKLDFYSKWITADDADYWGLVLLDSSQNTYLSHRYTAPEAFRHLPYDTWGYHAEWMGPMQPLGEYQSIDLKYIYDNWVAQGQFRNPDGSQNYEMQVGFLFYRSDETATNVNEIAESAWHGEYWSGLFVDDISIKQLVINEEHVWEDTLIIPGPLEPGDCEEEVQFEWEDVPYSNYRITVESTPGCGNLRDTKESVQILVVSNKERADEKEVESIDLTDYGEGEWGICSSDYDNYLSTNPDSELYPAEAYMAAYLAPDYEDCTEDTCINVSHLNFHDVTGAVLYETFDSGIPAGWADVDSAWVLKAGQNTAGGDPPEINLNYANIVTTGLLRTSPFDTSFLEEVYFQFRANITAQANVPASNSFKLRVEYYDGSSWLTLDEIETNVSMEADVYLYDVTTFKAVNNYVRISIINSDGTNFHHLRVDDFIVWGQNYAPDAIELEFDAWFDTEMWWDYAFVQISNVCLDEATALDWENVQIAVPNRLITTRNTGNWYGEKDYMIEGASYTHDGIYDLPGPPDADGFVHYGPIRLNPYILGDEFVLRIGFWSDTGFNFRGVIIDDLTITNLLYDEDVFPPEIDDFEDEFDDMSNWCTDNIHSGQYWEYMGDDTWCNSFPWIDTNLWGWVGAIFIPVQDALVWSTEIEDCYEAYLTFEVDHFLAELEDCTSKVYVQISDDGGTTWYILDIFTGDSGGWVSPPAYDISFWAGSSILIRFLVENGHGGQFIPLIFDGFMYEPGYFCVRDLEISGKQDHEPPMSTITMSGTMSDAGWYSTPVNVKITATDNNCVKEIHYILDGSEKIVAGDSASFTVSANGAHNIEYWAVDCLGNVEPHHTVPTFRIDAGSPPTVAITAPEPGLYLFGNKLLTLSKVFIIGAFNVEATATDAQSGVYRVEFYLDNDLISEDTEPPYNAYIAAKHMGAGTIKVVAEDFSGNTASDTLDITYYKFL